MDQEEHEDVPPPSYAEATGSSSSLPLSRPQNGYADEKQRLRQSLRSLTDSCLPQNPQNGSLGFAVDFKKPMLDFWTMNITPSEPLPELSYWQLKYHTRYKATVRRHAPEPQSRLPLKEVAEIKFPESSQIWPGCGPTITFWPHEEEIQKRGLRHVSATDKFMHCTGWLTSKFALDLPALGGMRVIWKVARDGDPASETDSTSRPSSSSTSEKAPLKSSPGDGSESKTKSASWTPFPIQHLVKEWSSQVLATYSRAAPWSKHEGYLTILPFEQDLSAEVIEGIVISTAAMIGMQHAIGLAGSLIESGFGSMRGKGKGKAKEAG